ncbi:hypothetical protein [Streptomyces sp. Isolate_219]|uniref:hypothetical protein n=1 Tax=Streptomyces sp. Isolate_219 TaxID=2950110 RepID=UPI0021C81A96|nr:hypothetical protein [Streptomyces sp. Isolate_219]MCR8574163.1 hypothetical protein [Streptomyces sp. Isolate_219]
MGRAVEIVSARTRQLFWALSSGIEVHPLQACWEAAGFSPVEASQVRSGGARKQVFKSFVEGVDWTDEGQVQRALRAFEGMLEECTGFHRPLQVQLTAPILMPMAHQNRRVPDFRPPKSILVSAALLAHLPNPGLGKPACIWQLSTSPSGSPCLARLGRRSDVTSCYTSVTVHNLFRRAGTTHHGEDHPTRDPSSGRAPSITWRSPTNADARWVVPAAQRPARRLHRMAVESSIEERNVHARPEHRHGHRNSIGTGGRP